MDLKVKDKVKQKLGRLSIIVEKMLCNIIVDTF